MFIRSASLDHSISRYLISRIDASPKITLHPFTEISALHGEDTLAGLEARDNRPGVFAAGDVRAGSTKRVASAVGEGSICVQFIHQALTG